MPKVLLLSRQPLAKRPLQDWLDHTESVVLVTTPKAVAGSEAVLAEHFPQHLLVEDYHGWSALRAAEAAARSYGVDLIASTSEHDVLRAARLRERLGLPGQGVESAIAHRDKVVMKRLTSAAGLPMPAFVAVDDAMDLLDFVDAQGFPVVVKPRDGAGAEGVSVLASTADVDAFLARQRESSLPYLPGQWMAESFVHGDFFHVDGVMVDGRIVHGWPSQYNGGVAERVRDSTCLSSVLLAPEDPRNRLLMGLTADVIAALPRCDEPLVFHLEAWLRADGRPVFCEIASRSGGALVAETYERAFGVHLAKEGLRVQCGEDLTLTEQPAAPRSAYGWILVPPGHGKLVGPASPCPVPGVEVVTQLTPGTERDGLAHATDAAIGATVFGDTPDQVDKRMGQLVDWWRLNTSWV